MYTYNCTKNWF